MLKQNLTKLFALLAVFAVFSSVVISQKPDDKDKKKKDKVRPVTVPISILTKGEIKAKKTEEFIEAGDIFVKEDGDEQVILSIRSVSDSPLYLSVLIQEDSDTNVNQELKGLAETIKRLPKGSRVMVGYLRGGSLNVRQKFTDDLEKASKALRIVSGSTGSGIGSPYDQIGEAIDRFDSQPNGRRAILLVSDGFDVSNPTSTQSLDLDRAVLKAQRKSVAIYSIFATSSSTQNASSFVILNAQGLLNTLSDETGGKAYFQGTSTPISFEPFLKEISITLNRQFALTYLSTHSKKGYHKILIYSTNPDIKIEHPKGYVYR
jgi:VWFA-related protein